MSYRSSCQELPQKSEKTIVRRDFMKSHQGAISEDKKPCNRFVLAFLSYSLKQAEQVNMC